MRAHPEQLEDHNAIALTCRHRPWPVYVSWHTARHARDKPGASVTTSCSFWRPRLGVRGPQTTLVEENLLLRQPVIVPRRHVKHPRPRPFAALATLAGGVCDCPPQCSSSARDRHPMAQNRLAAALAMALAHSPGPPSPRHGSAQPHPPHVARQRDLET